MTLAKLFLLLACIFLFIGCQQNAVQHATVTTVGDVSITLEPTEVPEFRRIYKARLNERASITVEIKTWYHTYDGSRTLMKNGELRQPDGKWVLFDPDAPAEKILDRELVPLVQQYIANIYQLDNEFRSSQPKEFTDESGAKWKRTD